MNADAYDWTDRLRRLRVLTARSPDLDAQDDAGQMGLVGCGDGRVNRTSNFEHPTSNIEVRDDRLWDFYHGGTE